MSCRSKMPMMGRNTSRLAAAMVLAAAGGACDGDASDDWMSTRPTEPTRGVYGTLLHEEVVGEQHTIEFFDVGNGMGLVRELMPAGQRAVLDNIDEGNRSLATYFRLVRPTTAVPATLLDADERALLTKAKLDRLVAQNPSAHTLAATAAPIEVEDPSIVQVQSAETASCSADMFGDAWGAQWFRDNFCGLNGVTCTGGTFTTKVCDTNWSLKTVETDRGFIWRQMAGDFNVPGHTKGWFKVPLFPQTVLWDHDIAPRTVAIHAMTSGSSNITHAARGTDPCSHGHRVRIWCQ